MENKRAGFFRRGLAFLIDFIPVFAIAASLRNVDIVEWILIAAVYQALFRLRTPGRWIARIAIVRKSGDPVSSVRSFLRTLGYILSTIPFGLGFLWALRGEKRAFHDRLVDTIAVRAPSGVPLSRWRTVGATLGLILVPAVGMQAVERPTAVFAFNSLQPVAAPSLPNGKVAMVAYMLTGSEQSEETWRTTLRRMKAMGVRVVEIGQLRWDDNEPEPGKYKWGYGETVLRINKEENLGLEFIADIGMFINPGLDGVPKLPGHLEGKAYDDPAMIDALGDLYEAFLKLPGGESITYLFNHFENAPDAIKDPSEVPRLQKLLRKSFARAKRIRPDIRTGVCIQRYAKPHWPEEMVKTWNVEIGTDVLPVISFGPAHFENDDPRYTAAVFDEIAKAAHGMPIALNECGHSSGTIAGSSDDTQALFVRELFSLLSTRHEQIELATWYEYSDLKPYEATLLSVYLSSLIGNPLAAGYFASNMGTCGLLTADGEAKPAAKTWMEEVTKYYRSREVKSE